MAAGVFFLDFDGPFFPRKSLILPENRYELASDMCKKLDLYPKISYWKMDSIAIAMANNWHTLIPYDAVISSSWSHPLLHNKEQIQNLMDINGFECTMHSDWRTDKKPAKRIEQIAEWLSRHPDVTNYIILDDDESGAEMLDKNLIKSFGVNPDFVFMIDMNNGITLEQYHDIYALIYKWK